MNNLTQTTFDYSTLTTEVAIEIRSATEEVKLFLRMSAEGIIRAGKKLIQIKDKLSHGQFIQWVETELNISRSTANHFIQVANKFDGEMSNYSTFAPTILYALAAPSTPEAIIDQAIDKANSGEKVTVADVKEWKLNYNRIKVLNDANDRQRKCFFFFTNAVDVIQKFLLPQSILKKSYPLGLYVYSTYNSPLKNCPLFYPQI